MACATPVPHKRSYWVEPGRFLAGAYPGDLDSEVARRKVRSILEAGVRTFVDLTEAGEAHLDKKLAPYSSYSEEVAAEMGVQVSCLRFGILGRLMDAMMVRREFTKIVPKVLAGLKHHVETGELVNQEVAGRLGDPAKVYA